jgi:type VI secretion system protein ImpK
MAALVDSFHEFYRELLAVDAQLDAGSISAGDAHIRLASKLNGQEAQAERDSGPEGRERYRRAKYAMAALADELLLNPDRPHAEEWGPHLLETALFHSQRAGEKIFDDILEMQHLGIAAAELARVYLAVVSLGFEGAYRFVGDSKEQKIADARRKLYGLAYGGEAVAIKTQKRINAAAYEATITDGESGKLPHIRPWIYAMVVLVLLYIGGSFALWRYAIADLAPKVQAIREFPMSGGARRAP